MSVLFLGSHKVFKKSNHYPWPNVIKKTCPPFLDHQRTKRTWDFVKLRFNLTKNIHVLILMVNEKNSKLDMIPSI